MACSSCTKRANAIARTIKSIGRRDLLGASKGLGYVGRSVARDASRLKARLLKGR